MSPKFSVVIATYRRRDYVLQAVQSVIAQTYGAHEIIVVIDGSPDDTAAAVRAAFPNVRVFEQENFGPSVAHNSGIALATGEWVCFLDDDDLWHRDKLSITAAYLTAHPTCRAVRNPVWFFTESDNGTKSAFGFSRDFVARTLDECRAAVIDRDPSKNSFEYLNIEGQSLRLLLERNRGVMSSSVVHRETLIRAGGFCPMQTCGDDWTMFVNVAKLTEWHTIPRRLGFTRLHSEQNSNDPINGLHTLVGVANAWLTGRPLVKRLKFPAALAELITYGPTYRVVVQQHFWGALLQGHFRLARMILNAGRLLLPRWRDRMYALLPPQLTWRFERYVLGKHK